jgi:hypothetical protein
MLGGNRQTNDAPPVPDGGALTFPVQRKRWTNPDNPEDKEYVKQVEWGTKGHHDFWYTNDTGKTVQVGLIRRSCKCSHVEIAVLPEERWKALSEGQREAAPEGTQWQKLNDAERTVVDVPPGAAGWVRMNWDGTQPGHQLLQAMLWMQAGAGVQPHTLALEVPIYFDQPYRLTLADKPTVSDADVGVMGLRGQRQTTVRYLCWSATRDDFTVTPLPPSEACFSWGQPVKLEVDELKDLEARHKIRPLAGYEILLTVRERVEEGALDLGPFERPVRVKINPSGAELTATVRGTVRGEVGVVSGEVTDRIVFEPFTAGEEARKTVVLESRARDLSLKVDDERTSSFLKGTKLKAPARDETGTRWELEVRIAPNAVVGKFPDKENVLYEDSAIYLTIHRDGAKPGEAQRALRIEVRGEAISR